MTTPPTAGSPAPKRHRTSARTHQDAGDLLRKLTPREAQTLALLASGHDFPHAAAVLGITPATARSYLLRAMRKLGAATEAEAVSLAAGSLPPPPAPAPANFAGLGPSSLGPASFGRTRAVAVGPDGGRPAAAVPVPEKPGAGRAQAARQPRPARAEPAHTPPGGRPPSRPDRAAEPKADGPTADGPKADEGTRTAPAAPEAPAAPRTAAAVGTAPTAPPAAASAPESPAAPVTPVAAVAPVVAGPAEGPAAPEASDGLPPEARPDAKRPAPEPAPARRTAPAGHGPARVALAVANGHDPAPDSPAVPASCPPAQSFEELYETAHTRLVQQVFLLTACRHRAVHCVRRAFGEARRRWQPVARSGDPEGWVRVRACELALSPWHRGGPRRTHAWTLPHRRIKVRPADETQAVLPDHDRLTDRDRALLKALKRLSRPQRRALVLHDGLGLPAAAVAVEVESTLAAAEGRVWTARVALAQWVPDLVGPDPAAPGFADGLSLLLHRAAVRGCPEPHRSPVPVLRARYRLGTTSRTGAAALLTVAVGGATLATLAGVRPAVLFRPPDPPAPLLCVPAAAEAEEPGVPLLPGGAPNGISSLWCSPAPGLEAVLVEARTQAVARWELPSATRGADAPPPQGPLVCPLWSPRPCTTGPRPRGSRPAAR
ncbi:sigma factor-like helix-turn-helix DNA-binding protein [Kitasatospora sp. NPDC056446]|uniref:sigma factor-like helix-turn-helix DNA-binding protein n=1 Tax=Kitasatospora sp. NPDC056446 TaxID=3345819 RepID=UPI00369E7923